MTSLQRLLDRITERPVGGFARAWIGPTPSDHSSIIAAIVSEIGLNAHGAEGDFTPLSSAQAAVSLALFATQPLLHDTCPIPPGLKEEIYASISTLGPDATFLGKGRWEIERGKNRYDSVLDDVDWDRQLHRLLFQPDTDPLPPIDVLVDGGVIGFNSETAFVYWVEEDD